MPMMDCALPRFLLAVSTLDASRHLGFRGGFRSAERHRSAFLVGLLVELLDNNCGTPKLLVNPRSQFAAHRLSAWLDRIRLHITTCAVYVGPPGGLILCRNIRNRETARSLTPFQLEFHWIYEYRYESRIDFLQRRGYQLA